MPEQATIERVTRLLAYMLRHQPSDFDVELDRQGWAPVEDVLSALIERTGDDLTEDDLEAAIKAGDRARYDMQDGKICALYGHSVEIDPGEGAEPPFDLFVGIPARDRDRLERFGLRGGRRRFLHLATTVEEAREVGRRSAVEYCIVKVDATDAWEQGIDFYDRKSLWMAVELPTYALEIIETHDDGQDPNEGRRGGGRGDRDRGGRGGRGGRERGGRDRGGRGRGRGRDEERSERKPREEREPRAELDSGEERRPRVERKPRAERKPREEREPREERDSGEERKPRVERKPRAEREPREERDSGDDRRPRVERAPREERPKREPRARKEEPKTDSQDSGGFGLGVANADKAEKPKRAPKPAAMKPRAPKEEPKPEAKPAAKAKPAPAPKSAGPGFGEGI